MANHVLYRFVNCLDVVPLLPIGDVSTSTYVHHGTLKHITRFGEIVDHKQRKRSLAFIYFVGLYRLVHEFPRETTLRLFERCVALLIGPVGIGECEGKLCSSPLTIS